MQRLIDDVRGLGGAAPRDRLKALGYTSKALSKAVRAGIVLAVGRKWLVLPDADSRIRTALEHRGLVGGAAALQSYGIWVTQSGLHVVAVKRKAHLGPLEPDVQRVQSEFRVDPSAPWRVTVLDALVQYCRRADRFDVIATVDSALHRRALNSAGLEALRRRLPARCREWLDRVNGDAEAGTESILRVACEDEGWCVQIQVSYRGGRLDLVIDGWLCIEVDGSEFHDVGKQASRDRRRNTQLVRDGYRWHRFGYADVVHRLDETIEVIRILLRQGRPSIVQDS
ncbi:hypothetical protein [uncultured Agrococcus sp.]|uniref:endonuclease domain-containing protein n=1 Tax=uncultured Agrococcus sp. TaxID=382258 RepID=UPI0025EECAE0|nr:hypothetical protein [uncultured Agrococcus sp.]